MTLLKEALNKDAGKKVALILDNFRLHHPQAGEGLGAERRGKIGRLYLSSCSPELNLEERLNADLKHAIGSSGADPHQGQA